MLYTLRSIEHGLYAAIGIKGIKQVTDKPTYTAPGGNLNETQVKILDIFKIHEKEHLKKMVLLGSENSKELIRDITIAAHCLCIPTNPPPPWFTCIESTKGSCERIENLVNSDTDEDRTALNDYVVSEAAGYDNEARLLFTDEKLCKDIEESAKLIRKFVAEHDLYSNSSQAEAEVRKVPRMLVTAVRIVDKY